MAFIRRAKVTDAATLAAIYGYYALNTVVTFSTEAPTETDYINKIEKTGSYYPFLVLEDEGRAIGFAYADRLRPHDAYLWEVELTIYLAPDAPKHQGYGRRLLTALMNVLRYQGFQGAYSVITYPNEPSVGLHKAMGFTQVGYFEKSGFKKGRWLDVVWLYKPIGDFPDNPKMPTPFSELGEEQINMLISDEQ